MRMARATLADREAVRQMLRLIEDYQQWGEWWPDPNGEPERLASDSAFAERLLRMMSDAPGALQRVVWGFETLVDQVCDPTLDYLDYKPELKQMAADAARVVKAEQAEARDFS